jgi:aspartyl-tRNA(Asn)/glutamyl-tRNA(Gln) amidotransferase subunit A
VIAGRGLLATAADLEAGRTSAVELVEECLRRAAELEPEIHALVTSTADLARAQAVRADRRRKAGESGRVLGMPVVVKDLIDVAGVPTTAGSRVLAGNVPQTHAPVWALLEAAGAVLVGKANTHEFAYGGTTEPTRNPSDLSRIVGGSSGGPAAALAAGYCMGAVGTDTAGSVRIPANLCGVAALKPTRGLVESTGVVPLSQTLDAVGPMARNVADLDPLLQVMGRLDGRPVEPPPLLRVGVLPPSGSIDPSVAQAVDAAIVAFGELGASVRPAVLEGFETSVFDNFAVMGREAHLIHQAWADKRDLYTPYVRDRLTEAARVTREQYEVAVAAGVRLGEAIDCLLEDVDVLLVPGVPFPASPAYDEQVLIDGTWEDRDTGLCRNTAFANLTGHPTLAVPAGLDGILPVGVQLVGRRGSDLELIAHGSRLQELLPPGLPVPLADP